MNRSDKLKTLENKKAGTGMTIMTDGGPFLEALGNKIEELRKVLGVDLNVDISDLVEQLSHIQNIAPLIDQLSKSVQNIDVPDSVKLSGLADLEKLVTSHIATINSIPKLKIPDANIKVDVQQIGKAESDKIILLLTDVVNAVKDIVVPEDGQKTTDYKPMRRVRLIGNKLVFDDDAWSGGGGGGTAGRVQITNIDGSGIDNSSGMYDGTTAVTPKFAVINASSGGDNIIVAAVTGKKIRVLSYAFVSSGTVNVKWQSGATDISGLMYFIANTGISAGYNPKGHFQTAINTNLELNLSAGIALGGHINYIEVD